MVQRYFSNQSFSVDGFITLTGEDYKHIVQVMRMAVGDSIIVVAEGEAYMATITLIEGQEVVAKQYGDPLLTNEMPIQVTIVNGLAKGDKHDLIVQKSTEAGVHRIIPFKAARSIVKWDDKKSVKKIERLQKIALQAAEQCHRTVIPTVEEPMTLHQLMEVSKQYDVCLFADEEEAKIAQRPRLQDRLKALTEGQRIMVVFGPEGGLSREEVETFQQAGFQAIALGPRILRTETAPLVFLSALSYEFE